MLSRWVYAGTLLGMLAVMSAGCGYKAVPSPEPPPALSLELQGELQPAPQPGMHLEPLPQENAAQVSLLEPEAAEHRAACQQVPVLLYHDVRPGASGENGAVVSVEEFAAQMAWLYGSGFHTITTAQLLGWLRGEQELPERPVLITFDDGYRSVYGEAYPILKQYGLKAAVFIVTSYVGQQVGDLAYLSWDEMKEMAGSGLIEIQAHSHNAHFLVGKEPALLTWSAAEIKRDLRKLNEAMRRAGLQAAQAYAYPYGAYDAEVQAALRESGIKLAFTTEHGHVTSANTAVYALPRITIFPGIKIDQFARLVTGPGDAACRAEGTVAYKLDALHAPHKGRLAGSAGS